MGIFLLLLSRLKGKSQTKKDYVGKAFLDYGLFPCMTAPWRFHCFHELHDSEHDKPFNYEELQRTFQERESWEDSSDIIFQEELSVKIVYRKCNWTFSSYGRENI